MSAAVSLASDPLFERTVAANVLFVASVGLDRARLDLDRAETRYLEVKKREPADRAEELRAGIALGDERERTLRWVAMVLRAELALVRVIEGGTR